MKKIYPLLLLAFVFFSSPINAQLNPIDLSWDSLRSVFNSLEDHPRIVSVLSTNCPPCRTHRDDIRDQIFAQCNNPDLRWILIWFEDPGHPSTRASTVTQAALTTDSRVHQWWFEEHSPSTPKNDSVARHLAASSWIGCTYAWDITMLFDSGAVWTGATPPMADYCMAKVGGCCNSYSIANFKAQVDLLDRCDTAVVVGVESEMKTQTMRIYPNPSNGIFYLQTESTTTKEVSILNIAGRTVWEGKIEQDVAVDLSAESEGIYFLQYQQGTELITRKIVLMK